MIEFQELWDNRMKNYNVDDCKYYDLLTRKIISVEQFADILKEIDLIEAGYRFERLPFTGYCDKNGNKIYLNDILLFEDIKCVVYFINYKFVFSTLNIEDGEEAVYFDNIMKSDAKNYIEVIGNTYLK